MSNNKQISEITQKIIKLFGEKNNNIYWPKGEILSRFKTWHQEIKAEAEELEKILAKGKKIELSEVVVILSEFKNWQTERQEEVVNWERQLAKVAQKRMEIEKEISGFLSGLPKDKGKKKRKGVKKYGKDRKSS